MDAVEIVKRAGGPAIATDSRGRILDCNSDARELLGLSPDEKVRGRALNALLEARDTFGNRVDFVRTPFYHMVSQGQPVNAFEIDAKKDGGERIRLMLSVVVVVGGARGEHQIVYFLRPVLRRRRADEAIERILANPMATRNILDRSSIATEGNVRILTRRQLEVLRRLAQGQSNEEIAESLFLSVYTVRSHVQSILDKLGVHSRAEAVSKAFRERLI